MFDIRHLKEQLEILSEDPTWNMIHSVQEFYDKSDKNYNTLLIFEDGHVESYTEMSGDMVINYKNLKFKKLGNIEHVDIYQEITDWRYYYK